MLKLYYGILRQSLHDSLRYLALLLITSALMFVTASQATAHSGGTNRYGCHAGTKPCHCHTPKEPIPLGIDPCDGTPVYTVPYYPDFTYSRKEPRPSKHEMTALYNKVNALYDRLTESIVYGLKLTRKKPHLFKTCEEWALVMKLMSTINILTPQRAASLERKCYDKGHRKFGRYMAKLIDRLPI